MFKKWILSALVALGCIAAFSAVIAAEPPPSGSVTMSSKAVGIGIGVSWGDGTLTFNGKTYPFSVEGLSVADLGVSNISTSGEVFNLKNVADFSGNYAAGEAGIAIAGGPSDTIMKNQNGVVLRLHGTQQGRAPDVGSSRREAHAEVRRSNGRVALAIRPSFCRRFCWRWRGFTRVVRRSRRVSGIHCGAVIAHEPRPSRACANRAPFTLRISRNLARCQNCGIGGTWAGTTALTFIRLLFWV